jgi:hypothetical protein
MNGWTVTRVWEIDEHLIVAPTIEEAVALFKTYMGKDYRDEPRNITAISNSVCCGRSYTALISENPALID